MRSARDRPGRLTLGGMLRSRLRIGRDACGFPATAAVSTAVCRCRAGGFTRIRRDAGNSLGWRVRVSSRSHRWRSQDRVRAAATAGSARRRRRRPGSSSDSSSSLSRPGRPGWSLSACPPAHRGYSAQPPAGAGLFQLVTVVWAILLGQSLVAAIFSTFSDFWLSFGALLLGLGSRLVRRLDRRRGRHAGALFHLLGMPVAPARHPPPETPAIYPLAVALVFADCAPAASGVFTNSPNVFTAAGAVALSFAFLAFFAWVHVALRQHVALKAMGSTTLPPLGPPVIP